MADMRLQAPLGVKAHQLAQRPGQNLGPERSIGAPIDADHVDILDQQDVGGELRHLPGGKADGQEPAFGAQGAQRIRGDRIADRVIDHVHPAQRLELTLQIVAATVDQNRGPGVLRHLELRAAARHGNHARAHLRADFDRGQANAARRPQHQQGFAGRKAGAAGQRHMRGAIGHHESGRVFKRHGIGDRQAAFGGKASVFGQPPATGKDRDPLADAKGGDSVAQGVDLASRFHAHHEGQGRAFLILAARHQKIGKVQPAGPQAHAHLAGGGFGHRAILKGGGRVGRGQDEGAHRGLLLGWICWRHDGHRHGKRKP